MSISFSHIRSLCENTPNDMNNSTVRRWAIKSINPSASHSPINFQQFNGSVGNTITVRRGDHNSIGFGSGVMDRPYGAMSPRATESGDIIIDLHRQSGSGADAAIILVFDRDIGFGGRYRVFFDNHTQYLDIPYRDHVQGKSRFAILGNNILSQWLLNNENGNPRILRMFRL